MISYNATAGAMLCKALLIPVKKQFEEIRNECYSRISSQEFKIYIRSVPELQHWGL